MSHFRNAVRIVTNPPMAVAYTRWVASGGLGRDPIVTMDGMKLAGMRRFSTFWGVWRNRPRTEEKVFVKKSLDVPKPIVVDVGANFGVFSLLASEVAPAARIFAFEPHPQTFGALERNVTLNGRKMVTTIQSAVGRKGGIVQFTDSTDPATNRIEQGGGLTVGLTTLDSLAREQAIGAIDLLKVDVEGAELDVLAGAQALFKSRRVRMGLIEVCLGNLQRAGRNPRELHDLVRSFGYELFWLHEPEDVVSADVLENLPVEFLGNAGLRPTASD